MSADTPGFLSRIGERLAIVGISESAASQAAFGHHKGISHLRNGNTKSPGIEFFAKLAPVLKTTAAWLAYGVGSGVAPAPLAPAAEPLRYAGEVAAGQWLDQETHVDMPAPRRACELTPNPKWPAEAQYVVGVRGTSVNRVAPDGSFLRCVDPRAIHYQAQNGDLVIVERRRNGGHDLERTAKRFRRTRDHFEFWPDSTDPEHKPIIITPGEEDESVMVEIIGLADCSVHPVEQDTPWNRGALS